MQYNQSNMAWSTRYTCPMGLHAQYGPCVHIHSYRCLIPARSQSVRIPDAKTGPKILKQLYWETLRHDISKLILWWHMENADFTQGDLFADEVDVDLDVLGMASAKLSGIVGRKGATGRGWQGITTKKSQRRRLRMCSEEPSRNSWCHWKAPDIA
jgi:hypothetical protein